MEKMDGLMELLTNQEPASVFGFTLSISIALVFGIMLNILYNLYFRDNEPQDGSLARSLVLLTPSLCATFWMIQSSIILSLGLLGSLSFAYATLKPHRAAQGQ